MTRPLPWWPITRWMRLFSTTASLVVRPGASTLVESDMKSEMPSLPALKGRRQPASVAREQPAAAC